MYLIVPLIPFDHLTVWIQLPGLPHIPTNISLTVIFFFPQSGMVKTVTGENGPTHLGLGPPHRVSYLFQNRNNLKWKAMVMSISLDLFCLMLS